MEAFEYQIRKDIRNNPIVREVDEARARELWHSVLVGGVFVVLLLRYGYRIEQLQEARQLEERANRHLRLQVQALQRPQRIEQIAKTQLKMEQPGPADAIVLERVRPADPPDKSIVALR